MIGRLAACFAAAFAAAPASASDWFFVPGAMNLRSVHYVDKDSLRLADGRAEILIYTVFAEDSPSGMAAMEVRYLFDCARSRGRMLYARTFDAAERLRSQGPAPEQWDEVAEGNLLAPLRVFACSNGASPAAATSMGSVLPFARTRAVLRENQPGRQ